MPSTRQRLQQGRLPALDMAGRWPSFRSAPSMPIRTSPAARSSRLPSMSWQTASWTLGIIQPLTVRRVSAAKYQLISGERGSGRRNSPGWTGFRLCPRSQRPGDAGDGPGGKHPAGGPRCHRGGHQLQATHGGVCLDQGGIGFPRRASSSTVSNYIRRWACRPTSSNRSLPGT